MKIQIQKIKEVKTPERGSEDAAGIDLFIPDEVESILIPPQGNVKIGMGIKYAIDKGTVLVAKNKSGIASKTGLVVGACVLDADYTGEVILNLINTSSNYQRVFRGQKIVQLVHLPYIPSTIEVVEDINKETTRGDGGFGSTGDK